MNQRAGIGRYAREIIRHLLPLAAGESTALWHAAAGERAFGPDGLLVGIAGIGPHSFRQSRLGRRAVDRFYFRAGLPVGFLLGLGNASVMYSPDFTVPGIRQAKRAVTVHDLAWQIRPEFAPAGLRRFLDSVVPAQIRSADRVFTVSQTSKQDILERYDVDPEFIVVAPNAAGEAFFGATVQAQPGFDDLGLPSEYLLMAGAIEPRKNHLTVLRALELVPDCPPLIIAGSEGWANRRIREAIARAEQRGAARSLGYVPDNLLPSLYAGSSAVVSASWYEGFGLPVLEGLSAGCVVAASDIPAHREIAGNLAVYFDPASLESVADGIISALARERPTGTALDSQQQWARRFSWRSSARVVWDTLKELA